MAFKAWMLVMVLLDEPDPALAEHTLEEWAIADEIPCALALAERVAREIRMKPEAPRNVRYYCRSRELPR